MRSGQVVKEVGKRERGRNVLTFEKTAKKTLFGWPKWTDIKRRRR